MSGDPTRPGAPPPAPLPTAPDAIPGYAPLGTPAAASPSAAPTVPGIPSAMSPAAFSPMPVAPAPYAPAPTVPGIPSAMGPAAFAPTPFAPAAFAPAAFAPAPFAPAAPAAFAPVAPAPAAPAAAVTPAGPVLGVRDHYQFAEEPVGQKVQVTILETPKMPPELPPPSKIDPGLEATRVALEAQLARNAIAALPYVPPTATRWFRFSPLELFMEHVLARRLWTVE